MPVTRNETRDSSDVTNGISLRSQRVQAIDFGLRRLLVQEQLRDVDPIFKWRVGSMELVESNDDPDVFVAAVGLPALRRHRRNDGRYRSRQIVDKKDSAGPPEDRRRRCLSKQTGDSTPPRPRPR
jgi:hypothetical protein